MIVEQPIRFSPFRMRRSPHRAIIGIGLPSKTATPWTRVLARICAEATCISHRRGAGYAIAPRCAGFIARWRIRNAVQSGR